MKESFRVRGVIFVGQLSGGFTAKIADDIFIDIGIFNRANGGKDWFFHCPALNIYSSSDHTIKGAKEDAAGCALDACINRAITLHNAFYELERGQPPHQAFENLGANG